MSLSTFTTTAASLTLTTGDKLSLAPGTNQVLTNLKGWFSPTGIRRDGEARLWAHGSFSQRGWRTERVVTLEGHIFTASRGDAARMTDTLGAALADGTAGVLTVDDADLGVRTARVYMTGAPTVDWDGNVDIFFAIDMVAPDPRRYGVSVVYTTPASNPGGGLAFDLFTSNGALDFGAGGVSGTVTAENYGTADTAPVFTVTGPAPQGFTITDVATGARLVYADPVPASASIRLDASDGSVLLDGYADRSGALTRREWTRIPGVARSTYLFEAPGGDGAVMSLEVASAWW